MKKRRDCKPVTLPSGETATVIFQDDYYRLVLNKNESRKIYIMMEERLLGALGQWYWHRVSTSSEKARYAYKHLLELAAFGPGGPGRIHAQ